MRTHLSFWEASNPKLLFSFSIGKTTSKLWTGFQLFIHICRRRRRRRRVKLRKMVHTRLEDATGLKEDLVGNAWSAAVKAHKYPPFLVEKSREFSIVSFAGSWSADDWFSASDSSFGETEINRQLFPSIRSIGVGDYAQVNSAFLKRFEGILGKLKEDKLFKEVICPNFLPIFCSSALWVYSGLIILHIWLSLFKFFGWREFQFFVVSFFFF